jgi:hypothetical protein
VVEDAYWKSKEDVHTAVVGCYSSMVSSGMATKILLWGELRADMVTTNTTATAAHASVTRGEISPENSIVSWNEFYTTISYCNKVIEKSVLAKDNDLSYTDALLKRDIAEATTIRALMYFYLVRSFSDVPLVLNASNTDDQDYYPSQSTSVEILNQLVSDLNGILNDLPFSYGDNDSNKGRFTRYGALALLADIYLWQSNYTGCQNACNQILTSGQFSLVPVRREERTVFDVDRTTILDTAYVAVPSEVAIWFDKLYVIGNSVESIFELQYPTTHETLSNPFFALFNSTTSRPPIIANEVVLDGALFPIYEADGDVRDIRRNYYQGSHIWKYVGASFDGQYRDIRDLMNLIIYRLPDIILMKAEALIELAIIDGNNQDQLQEAYELIEQVRERANAVETASTRMESPYSGKALEKFLLDERARELLFEGKRWYDVLRFAKRDNFGGDNREYLMEMAINSAPPEKLTSLQTKYLNEWFCYWPILVSAVEINKNLKQNPFYAN